MGLPTTTSIKLSVLRYATQDITVLCPTILAWSVGRDVLCVPLVTPSHVLHVKHTILLSTILCTELLTAILHVLGVSMELIFKTVVLSAIRTALLVMSLLQTVRVAQ